MNNTPPDPQRTNESLHRLKRDVADLTIQDPSQSSTSTTNPLSESFTNESSKARRSRRSKRDKNVRVQEAAAETAAIYYGECYVEGVNAVAADRAAVESHEQYKKWWLQSNTGNVVSSVGDAHVVPRYNKSSGSGISGARSRGMREDHRLSSSEEFNLKTDVKQIIPATESDNNDVDVDEALPQKKYYSVADFEYEENDWMKIGGRSARAAATATFQNDYNLLSSEQSTPHINNCETHRGMIVNQNQTLPPNLPKVIDIEGIDRSRGAKNPSPLDNFAHDGGHEALQPIPIEQKESVNSGLSKKKRTRQKSEDYRNLNEFFSLQRPGSNNGHNNNNNNNNKLLSNKKEIHEKYRRDSTNSDDDPDHIPTIPVRRASSFFHEASEIARRVTHHNASLTNASFPEETNQILSNEDFSAILTSMGTPKERRAKHIDNAKLALLHSLAVSGGDVTCQKFLFALEQLRTLYNITDWDARDNRHNITTNTKKTIEGMWLNLSRPNFNECLGKNSAGEYVSANICSV